MLTIVLLLVALMILLVAGTATLRPTRVFLPARVRARRRLRIL